MGWVMYGKCGGSISGGFQDTHPLEVVFHIADLDFTPAAGHGAEIPGLWHPCSG